jgi:hypothetical protein
MPYEAKLPDEGRTFGKAWGKGHLSTPLKIVLDYPQTLGFIPPLTTTMDENNNTNKNFQVSSVDVLVAIWSKEILMVLDLIVMRSVLFHNFIAFCGILFVVMCLGIIGFLKYKIHRDDMVAREAYVPAQSYRKKDDLE